MFSQTENFERCKECGNPYFEKQVFHVIDKTKDRKINTPVLVTKQTTNFKCSKCGVIISSFTDSTVLNKFQ